MSGEPKPAARSADCARTGPRTPGGRRRVARNALRHGLTLPVLVDPARAAAVAELARRIAGPQAEPGLLGAALRLAEAEIDLQRVRRYRFDKFGEKPRYDPGETTASMVVGCLHELAALDRYERRARARRRFAIRAFDAAFVEAGGRQASNFLQNNSK
ncbi:MAG: hypothetical protein JOZ40_17390 [Methylobacteriaceae bacterium]|nr:hypothetical protein [Methylobacteriaceae bacterium]